MQRAREAATGTFFCLFKASLSMRRRLHHFARACERRERRSAREKVKCRDHTSLHPLCHHPLSAGGLGGLKRKENIALPRHGKRWVEEDRGSLMRGEEGGRRKRERGREGGKSLN